VAFQVLSNAALLIAFGVKLPIVSLQTWLPDVHIKARCPHQGQASGAPAAGRHSSQDGAYALLRFKRSAPARRP
jgi:NAD(P)H-quinone oxidoreductase subunit 4